MEDFIDNEKLIHETTQLLSELSAQSKDLLQILKDATSEKSREVLLNGDALSALREHIIETKSKLVDAFDLVPRLLITLSVPWIGQIRDNLNLFFLRGDHPWEFYLTYPDDQEQLAFIANTIKTMHSKGCLVKCTPTVGEFVVCHLTMNGRHDFFRAIITNYNANFKKGVRSVHVYQVDTGNRIAVSPDDIYRVPHEIVFIPSRVIKCCFLVGDEHLKHKFYQKFQLVFKDAMKNSELFVTIIDVADESKPPLFRVQVSGVDKTRAERADFNEWINKVMNQLGNIPESTNAFESLDKCNIWDPYHLSGCETNINVVKDSTELSSANLTEGANTTQILTVSSTSELPQDPDALRIADSVNKVTEWMNGGPQIKLPTPEPVIEPTFDLTRGKIVHNSIDEPKSKSNGNESHVDEPLKEPPKKAKPEKRKPSRSDSNAKDDENFEKGTEQQQQNSVVPSKLSPSAPTFVPQCYVEITNKGGEDSDYDGLVTNLHEEYQPQDEKRVCLFFQKHGYCGFKLCRKEHVEKSSLWTTDTVATYNKLFNDLDLPSAGSQVQLTIQHVASPVSFYATLEPHYSDIGEPQIETLESLCADLNSMQSNNTHPLLTAGPVQGELVIALGQQDFLGPKKKWLRALVIKVPDDRCVDVFFLDFGNREIVKQKDLRQIRPQFLHLPAQAVLTKLSRLSQIPDKRNEAIEYLKTSIQHKVLKATITDVDYPNGELEVVLHMPNGGTINDILGEEKLAQVQPVNDKATVKV